MSLNVQLIRAQTKHTQFVYDLYANPEVMRGHGIHKPIPGPHWRSIIQGQFEGWQHIFLIAIGTAYVGHIGFQDMSMEDRRAEVVVSVLPSFHRKGIAYEALNQIMELGIESPSKRGLGLECIWAGTVEDNAAARALFQKSGFTEVGKVDDYYRIQNKRQARILYQAHL